MVAAAFLRPRLRLCVKRRGHALVLQISTPIISDQVAGVARSWFPVPLCFRFRAADSDYVPLQLAASARGMRQCIDILTLTHFAVATVHG
jgi:hypothetical protein